MINQRSVALAAVLWAMTGAGCLAVVTERQCDATLPCGSGWQCVDFTCVPGTSPDGGRAGGTAGGRGGGSVISGGGAISGGGSTAGGSVAGGSVAGGSGAGGSGGSGAGGSGAGGSGGSGAGGSGAGGSGAGVGGGGSCVGCIFNGACIDPTGTPVCGSGGQMCNQCNDEETCQNGRCVETLGCSMMSCPGCCSSTGSGQVQCIPLFAQLNFACGRNGQMCLQCPQGTNCSAQGTCDPGPPCGPTTCPGGCCIQGSCVSPVLQVDQLCGSNGQTCASCMGGRCENGQCVTTPPLCSITSCPNGCCASSPDRCVTTPQQDSRLCGRPGEICRACPAGQVCSFGSCVNVAVDAGVPCAGCRRADGSCVTVGNQSAVECGRGGMQCASCPGPLQCVNGVCAASSCGPGTCNGCCQGNQCVARPAQSASRCGSNGQVCSMCPFGQNCVSGTCTAVTPDGGLPVGSTCSSSNECLGGTCLPWLGGYCTSLCQGGTPMCPPFTVCPGGSCPGAATCIGTGGTPLCAASCPAPQSGRSTCRPGYVCSSVSGGGSSGICLPRCDSQGFGCPAGGMCNTTTGYCTP